MVAVHGGVFSEELVSRGSFFEAFGFSLNQAEAARGSAGWGRVEETVSRSNFLLGRLGSRLCLLWPCGLSLLRWRELSVVATHEVVAAFAVTLVAVSTGRCDFDIE